MILRRTHIDFAPPVACKVAIQIRSSPRRPYFLRQQAQPSYNFARIRRISFTPQLSAVKIVGPVET